MSIHKTLKQVRDLIPPLKMVFKYYCKLNCHSLKDATFDNTSEKIELMDLHAFMTFCKNLQITSKQHKKTDNTVLSQLLDSKRKKLQSQTAQQIHKYETFLEEGKYRNDQMSRSTANKINNSRQIQENQFSPKVSAKTSQYLQANNLVLLPVNYLNEKRLSQIFKKHTSQTGQINFELFIKTLKDVSQMMYNQCNASKSKNIKSNRSNLQTPIEQQSTSFIRLLTLINLETKQNVIETFTKINQTHGNMEHLSLLRSPIKKLNVKNSPLQKHNQKVGLIVNKQNQKTDEKKQKKSFEKLPKIQNKSLITLAKSRVEHLTNSIVSKRPQMQPLNKSYLQVANTLTNNKETIIKQSPTIIRNKKYSERHRDKIVGDINKKQIGDLIDTACLYDDQIFNKYVQLNYKIQR